MLPRARRLHSRVDIRRVAVRGMVRRTEHLLLRIFPVSRTGPRFGFVVSTKVSKRATERNRLKRVLRELVRSRQSSFPSQFDYLFTVRGRPKHDTKDFSQELETILAERHR